MTKNKQRWRLFFVDLRPSDPPLLSVDPVISKRLGASLLCHLGGGGPSSSTHHSHSHHHLFIALSSSFSKLAGAFSFWFSSVSKAVGTNFPKPLQIARPLAPSETSSQFISSHYSFAPPFFHNFSLFSLINLFTAFDPNQSVSVPLLSLAAAFTPPLDNVSANKSAVPLENAELQMLGSMDQCFCHTRDCVDHSISDLNSVKHTVEPKTGIEFPGSRSNVMLKDTQSSLSSEVLVGTGSRTMTVIKIKSMKVYAFGFYVHPYSVCQKLGPKYSSVPLAELNQCPEFYQDLLREDIGMTVRFVVNCNGMKINTVKDAIEKSLRARLLKTNPQTDFKCIASFSSCFRNDIPLPLGTTIDFQRTGDGQLITAIEGNQIGAVRSRDLCRAFFDMYIGEVPVSQDTKLEIGRNVASIIRRC